ncbi:MAG: L-seryl-tRNA(Sec) selenium transferase [Acidobacteria bacterium]|nr:L-seryl-tRNA(Sec) selenium transferase [Acidobacteriota bacterium]
MANPENLRENNLLRSLPSVDELLGTNAAAAMGEEAGRTRLTRLARSTIEARRKRIRNGDNLPATKAELLRNLGEELLAAWHAERNLRQRRVINAAGVVVHTNLGRAPLSDRAVKAITEEAAGYCTLEYDLETGRRGRRGNYAESLAAEICEAESAIVVNNCAAAALLVLSVFARGGETIVSRGELVEIGGDFRVPDVLEESGTRLREVGTTNRTKLRDYEQAICEDTSMILRVHPSNYRIIGFTETPEARELSSLAKRHKLLLYEDAGSGALRDMTASGLDDEPVVAGSIRDGVDIVSFSGDKLLGGPQCGILVGRTDLIERLRRSPLYRALRVDKLIYSALAATLESYFHDRAESDVPVQKMLAASREELKVRTENFVKRARDTTSDFDFQIVEGKSAVGGGASPGFQPDTVLIAIRHAGLSARCRSRLGYRRPSDGRRGR